MNKYGPGERLNRARYTLPVIPTQRESVKLGTLILIGANRLLDLFLLAFLAICAAEARPVDRAARYTLASFVENPSWFKILSMVIR